MRYLSLDFETSCKERSSINSIGYVLFEDGHEIESGSYLCKPQPFKFDEVNVSINGITRAMVFNKPPAGAFLSRIVQMDFDYYLCHNAQFDMSCLFEIARLQKFIIPKKSVICSMVLASATLNSSVYLSLGPLCNFLNIDINHHDAASDARACGELFKYCLKNNFSGIEKQLKNINYEPGEISSEKYIGVQHHKKSKNQYNFAPSPKDVSRLFADPINSNLKGRIFTFTGEMNYITRAEAFIEIWRRSGEVTGSTTVKTNYVVIGHDTEEMISEGQPPSKVTKAFELNETKGLGIEIINEQRFLDMINKN